jgi:hypothetical protein
MRAWHPPPWCEQIACDLAVCEEAGELGASYAATAATATPTTRRRRLHTRGHACAHGSAWGGSVVMRISLSQLFPVGLGIRMRVCAAAVWLFEHERDLHALAITHLCA